MLLRGLLSALLILSMSGCNFSAPKHDPKAVFDDPMAYRVSEEIVDIIRAKNVDALIKRLHPEASGDEKIRERIERSFKLLPSEEGFEITHYYSELRHGGPKYPDIPVYMTAYDVVGRNGFAQMLLAVAPHEGKCCVLTYWRIARTDVRPSTRYDLTFANRTWVHYAFFGLLFAVPVFIILTAIACVMNKHMKLKWLWFVFILFGFWGVEFNWATGEVRNLFVEITSDKFEVYFFQVHLLGAGIVRRGIFQPWIITIGIPIGAVLYWLGPARRSRRDREPD